MCMRKKVLSVALTAALAFSMTPSAAFATTDIEGHWGQAVLEEWEDYGVIRGYDDGTVRPDAAITRGEMATILDRIMGYQETVENEFSDLSEEDWCMDEMLRAVAAGAFHGDDVDEGEPATIRPNDSISREEAALVVSRVLDLDTENVPDSGFADDSAISDWAEPAVEAMAAAGYVNGYDDGTFRPQGQITRAEVVKIMDNVFADLYQAEGEYTGNVQGSAVIDSDGVVLKDMTISGDLIIAEGVADGHVELDNVTVEGRLIVRGGGENSVVIKGASKIGQIIVDRLGSAVRIAVQDAAEVADVVVSEAADGVRFEGKVGNLNVQGAASVVEVAGSVDNVEVSEAADEAKVTILEGAEAETVKSQAKSATIVVAGTVATVAVSGESNQLTISGAVTAVDVAGKDVVVKVEASATVEKVTTSASGTKVEGEGDVESVVAGEGSSDVTVSTEDTKVENNGSGDVAIEGGAVAPGETDTTPGGSTSGGGGVVVPPVHTHNFVDGVCTAGDGAYDPDWAKVSSADEWNAAMDGNAEGIVVTADFTANAQLKVSRAVTVNGNGHTVVAGLWTDGSPSSKGEASLVSVVAGNNAVNIKNITLKEAKTIDSTSLENGVKDYGHGLNVYESNNVALENVTLSNNDGAGMVVNSSTVKAIDLKTSGNGWGGVNIDNATAQASSFSFDGTSNFGDSVAVYSDNGDVTVNAPEGWAACEISGKTIWAKLFDGGYGTEESPYEISNLYEWKNLSYVATGNFAFVLTSDIVLESTENMLPQFVGSLDGGGRSVTLPKYPANAADWAAFAEYASGTIKNLVIEHGDGEVIPFVGYSFGESLEFDNVDICTLGTAKTCMMSNNDNNESAYIAQSFANSLTFKDCNNYLSYYHNGGSNMYTSAFLGGYAKNSSGSCQLSFSNCWNYGTLTMSHASLFVGNGSQMGGTVVTVENSGNFGQIVGYESAKPFAAISTDALKNSEQLNSENYNKGAGVISVLPIMDGLGLALSENQTIVINAPESLAGDITFNLTFAAYGKTEEATYLFNVIIPFKQAGDTDLPRYHMVDVETAANLDLPVDGLTFVATGTAGMRYAISGDYLVCDFGEYADDGVVLSNKNPTISVSVVDSEGNVIGYARLG